MPEYQYTADDRRQQLLQLVDGLAELIELLERYPDSAAHVVVYREARERAMELLSREPVPEELMALGRSIPDLFYRHREWEPPAEQLPDGSWVEASWFQELEQRLQPVLRLAGALASIGYY